MRFKINYKHIPLYEDIKESKFIDWKWQVKNLIRNFTTLKSAYPYFSSAEEKYLPDVINKYPLLISPYYLSLMSDGDISDPIRLQAIPCTRELGNKYSPDPLNETTHQPVPGLIKRYPHRALILVNNYCATYCRFCTRKRLLGVPDAVNLTKTLPGILRYLKTDKDINDILLSGGDALMMPLTQLRELLYSLSKIPSIKMVRLATRVPVTLPMKLFDMTLIKILSEFRFLWVITHFNHPSELTDISIAGINSLQNLGIPVQNQSVFLKGVNDNMKTLKALFTKLLEIRVRPYYIFHCDPVRGVGHFETDKKSDRLIINKLKKEISGLGVPYYVIDTPGGKHF